MSDEPRRRLTRLDPFFGIVSGDYLDALAKDKRRDAKRKRRRERQRARREAKP